MRHDLANRENASRRSSWLLPSYAAERLRVNSNGGDSVTFPYPGAADMRFVLGFGPDMRREGPISAYLSVADWIIAVSAYDP